MLLRICRKGFVTIYLVFLWPLFNVLHFLLYICLHGVSLLSRQESLKQVERERRMKYKKQDDEREVIRSSIRDKVGSSLIYVKVSLFLQYQLEKQANDEDYEDEDEDDEGFGGGAKKAEEAEEDPLEGNSTIFVKQS